MKFMKQIMNSVDETMAFGQNLGQELVGGEVFELVGDVGAGKTSFVKGLARGLGVDDDVQSPSFTISRVYKCRDELELRHYDFYRLDDAGIMSHEILEGLEDKNVITVVEWADTVASVLPEKHITIRFSYDATRDEVRRVNIEGLEFEL